MKRGTCRNNPWRYGALAVALAGCEPERVAPEDANPDQQMFAAAVVLSVGPVVDGGTGTLTVTGAAPFEDVTFVAGPSTGAGPCPGVLGGVCIGIRNPKVLGSDRADAVGTATFVWNTPGVLSAGDSVAVQAAIPRGAASVVTNTVVTVVTGGGIDADLDGFDTSADCDDTDPDVFPGAVERCDGVDTDCDTATSEDGLVSSDGVNFASLAVAASTSPDGALVQVCAGVYAEDIVIGEGIDLVGVGAEGDVVIDGSSTGPVDATVTFGPLATGAALRNVAIVGSAGFNTILVSSGLDVTLDRVVVTGSDVIDAPISTSNGSITLLDSTVSFNVGGAGGGLVSHGDVYAEGTAFVGNTTSGLGSAIMGDSPGPAVVELVDCVVESNTAGAGGGALYLTRSVASATVTDSDFGAGPTENLPADVDGGFIGPETTFQDGVSFTCGSTGCN